MKWFQKAFKNYAGFTGRARRKEYWFFVLFQVIFLILAMIVDTILGTGFDMGGMKLPYGIVYVLTALVFFIPGLAVSVRRLHDVGKSGWFILICLIPIIGGIWLLVLMCTDSQPGENKWGPNPKSISDSNLSLDSGMVS